LVPRTSDGAGDLGQLRREVIDRAAASGVRVPVAWSGANPTIVTYTTGHAVCFYASLDAYLEDTQAGRVDPSHAAWGRPVPSLVADWSADQCRDWLSQNP
jgi:hypothetical protein